MERKAGAKRNTLYNFTKYLNDCIVLRTPYPALTWPVIREQLHMRASFDSLLSTGATQIFHEVKRHAGIKNGVSEYREKNLASVYPPPSIERTGFYILCS